MASTYRDFTSTEVDILKLLAADDVVTKSELDLAISTLQNSNKSPFSTDGGTISLGVVDIERRERVTIASIDTEGQTITDILTTITSTVVSFVNNDILVLIQENVGRSIIIDSTATNIFPHGGEGTISGPGNIIAFRFEDGDFYEIYRFPGSIASVGSLILDPESLIIDSSGEITVANSNIRLISERTAETAATGSYKIDTTPGSSGSTTAFVDTLDGSFSIGVAAYTSATSPTTMASLLNTNINLGTTDHGYTATVLLDTVTVAAPAGLGTAANVFVLSAVNVNITTTVAGFSGGIDGTDQDDDLTTINGGVEGKQITITNDMGNNWIAIPNTGNIADNIFLPPGRDVTLLFTGVNWQGLGDICNEFCISKTLSSAEILALNSSPPDIVSAPGVGRVAQGISGMGKLTFVGTAYATDNTFTIITDTAGTHHLTGGDIWFATADTIVTLVPESGTATDQIQLIENKALQISTEIANPTLGDGTGKIFLTYKVHFI